MKFYYPILPTFLFLLTFMSSNFFSADVNAAEKNDLSGWKIYQNKDAGYTFKYPSDWQTESEGFYETAGGAKSERWSVLVYKIGAGDDVDNWIRINPRQFMDEDGPCRTIGKETVCTYSRDARILEILKRVADSFTFQSLQSRNAVP